MGGDHMSFDEVASGGARCARCGAPLSDTAVFCGSCGAAARRSDRDGGRMPIESDEPPREAPFAASDRERRRPWLIGAIAVGVLLVATASALLVIPLVDRGAEPPLIAATQGAATASLSSPAETSPSTSTPPEATPSTGPSAPTAPSTPAATPPPVAPVLILPGTARILADDVSVRAHPDLDAALVRATEDFGGPIVDEEVRLEAGTYVHVHRGPLIHDGFAWYLAMPLGWDGIVWNNGSGDAWDANEGWIAGGYDGSPWLLSESPPPTPQPTAGGHDHGGFPTEIHAGVGDARISTTNPAPIIEWNAASVSSGPCTLAIDLVTPDGSQDQRAVDETVGDAPEAGSWFASLNTQAYGAYEIVITGTCSWTFSLTVSQG